VEHANGSPARSVGELAAEDRWILNLDLDGFGREMQELGKRLRAEQGEEDMRHLEQIVQWSDICFFVGVATMWLPVNPLTVLAFCLWSHSRWTMIGHHSLHGGYNRVDDSGEYHRNRFGSGSLSRRVFQWFDWILPEAWREYHNQTHHWRMNETVDPDLFEDYVATWKLNKEFMVVVSMLFFKWAFAAPNTYKELKLSEMKKAGKRPHPDFNPDLTMTIYQAYLMDRKGIGVYSFGEFMSHVIAPYFLLHFVLLPLPLLALGPELFWHAVGNLVLAELAANMWGFAVTSTNHTGNDVYRFERGCKPHSPTFYLRAVIGSVNFPTGGNVNDFLHGWTNYQIEHHLWPDLSLLALQRGQPEAKAICKKYGVPYIQESIFDRMGQAFTIFTGRAKMRWFPDFLEREADIFSWKDRRSLDRDKEFQR
jgi:fatty acid desaturase